MSKIDKLIILILVVICEMLTKYSDKFYFGDIIQIKSAIRDMEAYNEFKEKNER